MNLNKIYKKSVIIPCIILLAITLAYSLVYSFTHELAFVNGDQFWTKVEFVFNHQLMAILYCIGFCISSTTIFLLHLSPIRSKYSWSFLSWFLLPVGFTCTVIGKAINELLTVDSTWELTYSIIASVPFTIGLLTGFRKFKSTNTFVDDYSFTKIKELIILAIKDVDEYIIKHDEASVGKDTKRILLLLKDCFERNEINERVLRGFKDICSTIAIHNEEASFAPSIFKINDALEYRIKKFRSLTLLREDFGKGVPI